MDLGGLVNNHSNALTSNTRSISPISNGLSNILNGSPNQSQQQVHHTQQLLQQQQQLVNGSLSSSPEKPMHYTYLKGFRVEQCALFLQHKCTNHKPFTCFDWHFQNQRRRRPVRRRDGTFNYSPDTYCTKYDETTGLCPDKDDCPFLHKTAGDTERRYHLRYYKTGICVYETDARGFCSKNGKHCAFAHGAQDLRNPVFDVRELQSLENGCNSSGELSDAAALPVSGGAAGATGVVNSIDRERNALLEDPRWNETAYVLANYKTVLCKRPPRFCRQGYACPQYHNGKDRRRSPKIFKYRSTPCPNTKQGDEWVDPSKCEQGDQCPYCHSRTEQQFHPEIFKSTKCKDIQDTGYCPRSAFCAFAHNEEEIVATRDIDLDNIDTDSSRPILSQSCPEDYRGLINQQLASENLRTTIESQLNDSLERMRPFSSNLDDDDDIFSIDDIRRMSNRNDNLMPTVQDNSEALVNNLLGIDSVIRPRSTSASVNSTLFSTTGIDLRGGSILQQQTAAAAAAAAAVAAAASYIRSGGPSLSSNSDINNIGNSINKTNNSISNNSSNQNELNLLSNNLAATRISNESLVNSLASTYNMELANSIAPATNTRLGVSFANQPTTNNSNNNSALPSNSILSRIESPNQTKNNLGPIARPRSYSHSQARSMNTDYDQLHAALNRARLIDESRQLQFGGNANQNPIGFRERAVQSFSISNRNTNDSTPSSLFNPHPISALDFLPSSRLGSLNLGSKDMDLGGLVNNHSNALTSNPKSISPISNGLSSSLNGSPNQSQQQVHHLQQLLQQQQQLVNGSLSSSPEKPMHYTYLKGFRVEQCALFLQHKCTNHKPFTCFDWHFQNQRRRRPVRRRDGTFNYSPDTYCTKYDETTGLCPDKDDCPFLHKTAGDTERRYHLRYYKTGICVYETDARGFCSKNGKHCAFAHGAQDLRNPVFDVRELQSLENGCNSSGELSDAAALPVSGGAAGATGVVNSIDRERNALLEDPRWNETAYVLANYKTVLCKRPPRFCRQGYACPQYHNGKDRRRSPKIFKYRSTPCPNTKQGDEWVDPSKCEQGDQCPYCHSRTEQQFHPEIFKSTKCKDIQDTGYCPRSAFCAFAHNEEEIVATRDIDLDNVDTEIDSSRLFKLFDSLN